MEQNNIEGKLVSISAKMEGVVSRIGDLLSSDDSPVRKLYDNDSPNGLYEAKNGNYVIEVTRGLINPEMNTISPVVKGCLGDSDVRGFWETMDHVLTQGVGYWTEGKVKVGKRVGKVYLGSREPATRETELKKIA